MFRPTFTCRVILVLLWIIAGYFTVAITGRTLVYISVPVVAVWLWLYLTGMKMEISAGYVIRHSGNIFKRKSIIMLKNIFYIQIISVIPWGPTLIRLHGNGETIIVIGLDGRQAAYIERAVRTGWKN